MSIDPSVLWASPLPPTRSGVADYAAEILPELARLADVRVLRPPEWSRPQRAAWAGAVRFVPEGESPTFGQLHLLHLGNNPYHLWVAGRLRSHGGVVVLHDAVLHHLLVEEAAAEEDWGRFEADLAEAHGEQGRALAVGRRWGYHGRLDPFLFAARRSLLARADAVVVHSELTARTVRAEIRSVPVVRVPLAVAKLPGGDRAAARRRLGVAAEEFLLVHLGFLTPAKGMSTVLRGLAVLVRLGVRAKLVVVGEEGAGESLGRQVDALDLADKVMRWGWASRRDLGSIISAADLGVVPRYPTAGETSAAALRFLAAGKPIMVSGYAQFLEFPAAAAMRLSPGAAGVADFVRHVTRLASDPGALDDAGRAASQAWDDGGHQPAAAAASLLGALEDIGRGMAERR